MNYFCHGRDFVDQPYRLMGTAMPDLLNVVDRKVRVREKKAATFLRHEDHTVAEVAGGIVRHHQDDRWFHQTPVFNELCLSFTSAIRDYLPSDRGFRPAFLGHVLVELLLDAALIELEPARLDAYYEAWAATDPLAVERAVNQMATSTSERIAVTMDLFHHQRFLYDYLQDGKLLKRLNSVRKRVGLAELPDALLEWFPTARRLVYDRHRELLRRPSSFDQRNAI